jgi:hypothetical protein
MVAEPRNTQVAGSTPAQAEGLGYIGNVHHTVSSSTRHKGNTVNVHPGKACTEGHHKKPQQWQLTELDRRITVYTGCVKASSVDTSLKEHTSFSN